MVVPALSGSSVMVALSPKGSAIVEAPNSGPLVQGYASFSLPAGVTSYGVFRQSQPGIADQEAVVTPASAISATSTLIFDDTNYVTSVAIVNPGIVNATVTVTAWDLSGNTIGTSAFPLAAHQKNEMTLRSLPGLAGMAGQRGTVQFTMSAGSVAVLGLRFNGAAFTSIPAVQR